MPPKLIRDQVTRKGDGDWYFGYTRAGAKPLSTVGAQDLSNEVVRRIVEQRMGPLPLTGWRQKHITEAWNRLEPVLIDEIERRVLEVGR
jgi:hypothetical protein